MPWLLLTLAGLLEVCWASGMKYSQGFSRIVPSVFTIVSLTGSVVLLALAMRHLPLGTAYAVWTGIGAVGTVIFGICFFGESASPLRIICLILILAGIAGLKFITQK